MAASRECHSSTCADFLFVHSIGEGQSIWPLWIVSAVRKMWKAGFMMPSLHSRLRIERAWLVAESESPIRVHNGSSMLQRESMQRKLRRLVSCWNWASLDIVLVYSLRFMILIQLWILYRRLRDRDLKILALGAFVFQLQFMHFNSLVYNLTSGAYYWFFTGFLFLLPKLERIQAEQRNSRTIAVPLRPAVRTPLSVRPAR